MEKAVSMEDIARQLGISKMTVSKALRGLSTVSVATRERVRAKASEMGYKPNPMVASLMQQVREKRVRGGFIPTAYVAASRALLHDFETGEYIRGAKDRSSELGYLMEVVFLADYGNASQMASVLQARGIRGIICGPCDDTHSWQDFSWDKFSSVSAGLGHARLPNTLVRRNISQGIRMVENKLCEAGFKRPAILFTPQPGSELDRITEGALHMMIRYGSGDFSLIHGFDSAENIRAWLRGSNPDIIVLHFPPSLKLLQEAGFGVKGPLPIITLKTYQENGKLAGLDHRPYQVGHAAAELLSHEIQLNRTGKSGQPPTMMIDCEWVDSTDFANARLRNLAALRAAHAPPTIAL